MKGKITAVLGLLVVLQGCRQADSVVLLSVAAGTDIAQVSALRITMSTAQSRDSKVFPVKASAQPVSFPTSLVLVIPRSRSGRLDLVVEGLDVTSQRTVASGTAQVLIAVGGQMQTSVVLTPGPMLCGNGVIDPGESCDDGNLYSFDNCDFRCLAEGPQLDAGVDTGLADSPMAEAGNVDGLDGLDGLADAAVDGTFVETGMDISVQGDSSVDDAIPDVPHVADVSPDCYESGTGGDTSIDGTVGAGGSTGAGGMVGAGGNMPTGGTVDTGGTAGVVGTTGTGGNASSGGTTNAGGNPGTGGNVGTGGSAGTGGNSSGGAGGIGGSTGIPAGTPGQSCSTLAATCGPYGNESCCASLLVPGGAFYRSFDGVVHTDKSYPATVSDFALDRYEVTVGRFRALVNAGMGTQVSPPATGAGEHPLIAGSGWDSAWNANLLPAAADLKSALKCEATQATWTSSPGVNENRPVNCATWYEAFAFCAWDGGRLPTEAEWNYAASGGSEQRYYPWSNPPTSTTINGSYAVYFGSASGTLDVGSKSPKGDGKWGHADLGGNLWEKVLDWFADPYSRNICTNCADLAVATSKTVRGGGFLDDAMSASRGPDDPLYRNFDVGFRCARAK
jgi:cysteine-rich repeat protein